jgi:hypothetical protein
MQPIIRDPNHKSMYDSLRMTTDRERAYTNCQDPCKEATILATKTANFQILPESLQCFGLRLV